MSNLSTICRPHAVFTAYMFCTWHHRSMVRVSFQKGNCNQLPLASPFLSSTWVRTNEPSFRVNQKRTAVRASKWDDRISPYETLELERDADEEQIKVAYRRLAKFYHPDVYDGRGTLEKGETAEAKFIKIQAAYELLIDGEKRRQYDMDHRVNPMRASQAWMEWLAKKRKAFDQRGDMAVTAWAEQQQREMNLRARRLARSKMDPDEEKKILAKEKKASIEYYNNTLRRHALVLKKKILAKEKKASIEYYNNTLRRHALVLKKRDLNRKKAEEEKRKIIGQLLAAEGFELDSDEDK